MIAYLIGSISGSYIISKFFLHDDIRQHGSGNAGTTNAMRTYGKKIGALTFLIDFFKGVFGMLVVQALVGESQDLLYISALALVVGHDFPFYMNFKGGKGVASTIGCFSVLGFVYDLIAVCLWNAVAWTTKYASLASIVYYLAVAMLFIVGKNLSLLSAFMVIAISLLGILRHHQNIRRLLNHTESKIGEKK
ncbi:glycerol-3-phosphate 1-O-acyltransferase PlsY [Peptoniphilus equinus]|uniref:Glycerol-3-phosphate acyltransferase n=1 Tax=Peptoniphilus equinus TaxID=3016343 RepID=A0ABY7QV98_9FIRM|nr:glycerol-3-phosphate 1-O-acyltransferase PlsY [Peptoniphilus equinus]WBW50719.1 glycerol-3-phosphate 1-O-acyltransferase PlsY [Peptoniphilus equinus]